MRQQQTGGYERALVGEAGAEDEERSHRPMQAWEHGQDQLKERNGVVVSCCAK
jgi:hypothetical protein